MDENWRELDILHAMGRQQLASGVAAMRIVPVCWYGPVLRKTAVAVAGFAVLVVGVVRERLAQLPATWGRSL